MESLHESLWLATSPSVSFPPLTQDIKADIAVVGAGIAGILTAYLLTKAGKKVVLLEAHEPLYGTTSFTTAKVTILHGGNYSKLIKTFGVDMARLYAESNTKGIDWIESVIKEEKIDCSFRRVDSYLFTNEKEKISDVYAEYEALRKINQPVELSEGTATHPIPIMSALKLGNQAVFHPRTFLIALMDKLQEKGCRIYGNSRVTDVKDGSPCLVQTEKGVVKAHGVVIATNYPIVDTGFFYMRLAQIRSYALAVKTSKELPDTAYIGLGDKEITLRIHDEGSTRWAIVGNIVHPTGQGGDTRDHYKEIEKIARQTLPVTEVGYRWSAQDATSPDEVPFIGRMPRTDHLYVTTGYGEWGMTTSAMSALLLSDLMSGKENEWSSLYDPARIKVKENVKQAVKTGKEVINNHTQKMNKDSSLNSIKKGEGKVIDHEGKKVAVCRDEKGNLCALSAVCTHMGCTVAWNAAEQSWDCPCHGSRFGTDGEVIHSPAIKPLERVTV